MFSFIHDIQSQLWKTFSSWQRNWLSETTNKLSVTILVFFFLFVLTLARPKEESNSLSLSINQLPFKAGSLLWKINWKGTNLSYPIFFYYSGQKLFSLQQNEKGIWERLGKSYSLHSLLLQRIIQPNFWKCEMTMWRKATTLKEKSCWLQE